ncbi:hypothetical protein SLEP1_g53386 [Rubroshorea leprosula]|uniref:RING-type E3 ubiquitin transferase n=1 Tax=Rubroshorea leprosula TaxID=152421 RepID=A0AAV5M9F0_9ROSI|nr:hypothetical protein SLEP1_g53386 [Rubroshorea leprosula]
MGRSKKGSGRGKGRGPGPTSQQKITEVGSGDSQKEKQQATAVTWERSTAPASSAQVVGNAFVHQYYHILLNSPEVVHRFYQDTSFLSRPDVNGNMTTVTTMKAINEKILSLHYEDHTAEIETADAQDSYEKGVIVLVTGYLIAKDNVRKKFTQTFFLAPQDNGYFIFSDVLRYIGDSKSQINSVPANSIDENTSTSALAPEPVRKVTEDYCVVCADTLKWVAYGPCGHKEVCSTCVIRLRLVCEDRRCCLCKCESNIIFVTRALGDYTKEINDFAALPDDPPEGQVGPYWYHEGTQAFFDDLHQYKMTKAMCMLSCAVCQKDEQRTAGSKRQGEFENFEQLKSHLLKQHELLMCSLCLEGRKVFICEQKLYSKAQLIQHIRTGDSTVDGNESERGGFAGHPLCEFCQNPFYGDNELYLHMSTEHYTCHICQRQHPGQHEYYRNYDDMEIHFRQEHFLCEDEDCLSKKFVVFSTNSELKRHTAIEHGGRKSRSKRNATLQIPVSFQYQRSYEQNHEGGEHGSLLDSPSSLISSVTWTSLAIGHAERLHDTPTRAQVVTSDSGTREVNSIVGPFSSLATTDCEPSSRHCNTQQECNYDLLAESSFPPLAATTNSSQQKSRSSSERLSGSSYWA